jgi:hypothetical protein
MGLLPTGTGDWLAFESRGQVAFSPFVFVSKLMKTGLFFTSHPRRRCFDDSIICLAWVLDSNWTVLLHRTYQSGNSHIAHLFETSDSYAAECDRTTVSK